MNKLIFSLLFFSTLFSFPQLCQGGIALQLKVPIAAMLQAGQIQTYEIEAPKDGLNVLQLERGSFAAGEEINLLVTVFGPSGELVEEVNTANDASLVIFSAAHKGKYEVMVRRWNGAAAGSYQITLALQVVASPVQQVQQLFDFFYDDTRPGAAFAFIAGDSMVIRQFHGLADLGHQVPISPDTRFELASLSKMFTAYGIALLIERGVLSPTTTLRSVLPEFPAYAEKITIHHLVHHLSGIKGYSSALALAGYAGQEHDLRSKARILRTLQRHETTYFTPGTEYRYSNAGYVLLGEIISRTTGTPYATWMAEEVFAPLGMAKSSVFSANRTIIPNLANSYRKEDGGYDAIDIDIASYKKQPKDLAALGSSGITTTLDDLAKWAANYHARELGGGEVQRIIRQGIIPEEQAWDWWYGFQRYHHRGQEVYHSEGLTQGYRTVFSHFPGLNTSLILLTNDGEWRTYYLARKITDLLLASELEPKEITSAVANIQPPNTVAAGDNDHPLSHPQQYVGQFFNATYGCLLEVRWADEQLAIHSLGDEAVPLQAEETHTFSTDQWYLQAIKFIPNAEGKLDQVKVRSGRDGDTFIFRRIQD